MRQRQCLLNALAIFALGTASAAAQSIISVGAAASTDPADAPQTQPAPRRIIGIPPSATSQPAGNTIIGPLHSPPVNVAPSSGLTQAEGLQAAHALALAHPNPDVRAAVSPEHDNDWNVNVELETFSLILRDPTARFVSGNLSKADGTWRATFYDNESLANPWTPPASASLTLEQSRALLTDMCNAWAASDPAFKRAGASLKAAKADPASAGAETILKSADSPITWKINSQTRTFSFIESTADAADLYTGAFGWDARKEWTAWPITHAHVSAADATHPQVNLMIAEPPKAGADATAATSAIKN